MECELWYCDRKYSDQKTGKTTFFSCGMQTLSLLWHSSHAGTVLLRKLPPAWSYLSLVMPLLVNLVSEIRSNFHILKKTLAAKRKWNTCLKCFRATNVYDVGWLGSSWVSREIFKTLWQTKQAQKIATDHSLNKTPYEFSRFVLQKK